MNKIKAIFTEPVRAWIYRVLMAAGAVAFTYGLISNEEIATWLGLAATVLNILPTLNTNTSQKP